MYTTMPLALSALSRMVAGAALVLAFAARAPAQSLIAVERPKITACSPSTAEIGDTVLIEGTRFDLRMNGGSYTGTPPWTLHLRDPQGVLHQLPFVKLSSTRLRATVVPGSVSGVLCLRENDVHASNVQLVVVPPAPLLPPPPPLSLPHTLRIQNDSQYEIVSLKVGTLQLLGPGQVVPLDGSTSAAIPSGFKSVEAKLGFRNASGPPTALFTIKKKVAVPALGLVTVRIEPLNVRQLLSGFTTSKRWVGTWFDANGAPHLWTYTFTAGGSWTLREGTALIASGTVIQVSWPDLAQSVRFLLASPQGGEVITLEMPLNRFIQGNGPPNFPNILYVRL